jgi:hypothetical protein
LVDFHRLAIPIIIILAIGGIISFFLAYSFYPKKNVNVNVDGLCFELVGSAFNQYKNLDARRAIRILGLQLDAMESQVGLIPISFSGTKDEISKFSALYNIEITKSNRTSNLPENKGNIDKYIVDGNVPKVQFKRLVEGLTIQDFDPLNKTVKSSIGIRPNTFLSEDQSREIGQKIRSFMQYGIKRIVERGDTNVIRSEDCRGVR